MATVKKLTPEDMERMARHIDPALWSIFTGHLEDAEQAAMEEHLEAMDKLKGTGDGIHE